ncbi:MAG: MGMT family protein [Victivallaceae bacterium]|nr:MGMT family protein [Victivallaceae bacterium]
MTEFQNIVYNATIKIPCGQVTTYKLLAQYINCGSCQAVGQALKVNPFAPKVPCHRVISSSRTIGGFAGSTDAKVLAKKYALLASEGIVFKDGKVPKKFIFHYTK